MTWFIYGYRRLTWRQSAWLFGGMGVACVCAAIYMSWRLGVELRTWPRVEAHVDSAQVVTRAAARSTMRTATQPTASPRLTYAARLWLTYAYDGRTHTTLADESAGWSDYGSAATAGNHAVQLGRVTAMLDPARPGSAVLRQGSVLGVFIFPAVIAFFGLVFAGFGSLAQRAGSRLGMDTLSGEPVAPAPRLATAILGILGALFVASAGIAAAVGPQTAAWTPLAAHVDSADAVAVSHNMYSVRRWLTYTLHGTTYHAPITASTSRNSFSAVSRSAADAVRSGAVAVLVDPQNPYRLTTTGASRATAVLIPLLFGLLGIACLGAAVWIHRTGAAAMRGGLRTFRPIGGGAPYM